MSLSKNSVIPSEIHRKQIICCEATGAEVLTERVKIPYLKIWDDRYNTSEKIT